MPEIPDELKPCPFCGGKAFWCPDVAGSVHGHVFCTGPGCNASVAPRLSSRWTKEEAYASWNRRAGEEADTNAKA